MRPAAEHADVISRRGGAGRESGAGGQTKAPSVTLAYGLQPEKQPSPRTGSPLCRDPRAFFWVSPACDNSAPTPLPASQAVKLSPDNGSWKPDAGLLP